MSADINIVYNIFSFISILICTYLYIRTIRKIENYWEFIIFSREDIILNVFLLTHFGVLLILFTYILEAIGAILIHYYLKFFASILFLIASIGMDISLKVYTQNPGLLEKEYKKYIEKMKRKRIKHLGKKEDIEFDENARVLTIFTEGAINTARLIDKIFNKENYQKIAVLGRTHPHYVKTCNMKVYLSFVNPQDSDYLVISPNNISAFVTFVTATLKNNRRNIFIGDFIETIGKNNNETVVFNFIDLLLTHIRKSESYIVFIINKGIFSRSLINIFSSISDVIVHVRNIDKNGKLKQKFEIINILTGRTQRKIISIY